MFPFVFLAVLVHLADGEIALMDAVKLSDIAVFKASFESALKEQKTLEQVAYAAFGMHHLNEPIPNDVQSKSCELAINAVKSKDIDSIYLGTILGTSLPKCKLPPVTSSTLESFISDKSTLKAMCYATEAATRLNVKLDGNKLRVQTEKFMKVNDSASDLAYAFYIATHLSGDMKGFLDRIEDCVAQADEIDQKYLQFEGGDAALTARIVTAIYSLAAHAGKAPPLKKDELTKFCNYLLTYRKSSNPRTAYFVLMALNTVAKNQFHIPLHLSLKSLAKMSTNDRTVKIRVSGIFSQDVEGVQLVADDIIKADTGTSVANSRPFTINTSDKRIHDLNLNGIVQEAGLYRIMVSTKSVSNSKVLPVSGQQFMVIITRSIVLKEIVFGVVDRDRSTLGSDPHKYSIGQGKSVQLSADTQQKLLVRFSILDKTNSKPVIVQQAFVQFHHQLTREEYSFVATNKEGEYKLDLDFFREGKNFNYQSGTYNVRLIVADPVAVDRYIEKFAVMTVTFPDTYQPSILSVDVVEYGKKPEIKHTFREPEKRPPPIVSDIFTILSLLPLVLMLILWMIIGANLSGYVFSLSGTIFHLSLSAIFGLYGLFWLKLNMFETLKYLGIIGCIAFLSGNKLLCSMARKTKAKDE